ncbi:Dityrosine transporter 1 [Pseudocyphellaria aurata]|nr:Dityrosine transporter 1 [Pseudocyphellaria aurata]
MDKTESGHEKGQEVPPPIPYTAFSNQRRNFILLVVTLAGFFGPLSGGIYLPALNVLAEAFNVSGTLINVTVSVFMLVFAVGPLLWAGVADYRGRRPLYIISFGIFILANIALAVSPAKYGGLVTLRIIQAFGSCSVASLGAGSVADIVEPKNRAFAMSIFLLGPQLGPVLGPLLGGLFAGQASWRWIFGFLAISSFCLWVLIIFCHPETLRSRVGNGAIYTGKSWISWPPRFQSEIAEKRGPKAKVPTPKVYYHLFCYPPIGIVSGNTAILFASYYCIAITQPRILADRYHWSTANVGFSYLASGIAMIVGSLSGGKFSDWKRARAIRLSPTGTVHSESRLADQIWGVLLCSAGTLLYGWFSQYRIHPAAFLISTFLAGFGMTWVFVTSTSFLTECVPTQAASVFALGGLLRNPAAAVAAVIIEPLVDKMGLGWCFTGLAVMDMVFVGGAVVLLKLKCPSWRKSRESAQAKF